MVALDRRLLHGGLPEALLAEHPSLESFSEWIDSFYARDILELFAIRNRQGFLALLRLLLRRSGGQLSYGRLASLTKTSRPTIKSYLDALEVAHAVHRLRPFSGGGSREIVRCPKCYAFDTGFVAFERGWRNIRPDDRGVLWEHLVLDTLRVRHLDENVCCRTLPAAPRRSRLHGVRPQRRPRRPVGGGVASPAASRVLQGE